MNFKIFSSIKIATTLFSTLVIILIFTLFCACKQPHVKVQKEELTRYDSIPAYHLQYDLGTPDATFKLPNRLVEISGLSINETGTTLLAVQDEKGIIFKIDSQSGKVLDEIPFWKDGDYEGIEMVGDKIYVVKSTGTIYEIKGVGTEEIKMEKFNTSLCKANDVEGLGYDAFSNSLLLTCKGSAAIEGSNRELVKAIYAFSLDSMHLEEKPKILIRLKDVQDFLKSSPLIRNLEKLTEYFQPGETSFTFNPSAIATHPLTKETYLLSATKKLLAILSPEGRILHIEKLNKKLHPQPEGICFAPDGTLFISNEGRKDKKARIHRYLVK